MHDFLLQSNVSIRCYMCIVMRNVFGSWFAFFYFVDFTYVVRDSVRMMLRGLSSGRPIRDELPLIIRF